MTEDNFVKIYKNAFQLNISHGSFRLLLAGLLCQGKRGFTCASLRTIANVAFVDMGTARHCQRQLIENGLLKIEYRGPGKTNSKTFTPFDQRISDQTTENTLSKNITTTPVENEHVQKQPNPILTTPEIGHPPVQKPPTTPMGIGHPVKSPLVPPLDNNISCLRMVQHEVAPHQVSVPPSVEEEYKSSLLDEGITPDELNRDTPPPSDDDYQPGDDSQVEEGAMSDESDEGIPPTCSDSDEPPPESHNRHGQGPPSELTYEPCDDEGRPLSRVAKRSRRLAHTQEIGGSNPSPAPKRGNMSDAFWLYQEFRKEFDTTWPGKVYGAFTGKEGKQAKELVKSYGKELCLKAIQYLIQHWETYWVGQKKLDGMPSISLLFGYQKQLFGIVQEQTPSQLHPPPQQTQKPPNDDLTYSGPFISIGDVTCYEHGKGWIGDVDEAKKARITKFLEEKKIAADTFRKALDAFGKAPPG